MKILLLQPDDILYYQMLLNNQSSSLSESSISLDNHVNTHQGGDDDVDLHDDIQLNIIHHAILSSDSIYSSTSSNHDDSPPLSPSNPFHKISTIYQSIYKSREIALKWLVFILKNIIKKYKNNKKSAEKEKPPAAGSAPAEEKVKQKEKGKSGCYSGTIWN